MHFQKIYLCIFLKMKFIYSSAKYKYQYYFKGCVGVSRLKQIFCYDQESSY